MSTAKKILGNTAVQVAGRAMMAAASIVILKIITGFLGVEGYGNYAAIYEFLAFFGIAADLGLFTIGVREMSKNEDRRDFIVSNILGMRIVLALSVMALAVLAAFMIPKYSVDPMPIGVAIASLAVFLSLMHGTVSSVLQVELKMQYSTAGLVLGKVISLGWMVFVIFFYFAGDPGDLAFYQLLVAGVIGNFFAFLYSFFYAMKFAKIRVKFDMKYWKEILFTAIPYGLALILNMVYFRIDSVMLFYMKGAKELGFYGPAVRILEMLSVVPVYFMNSALPVLSKKIKEGGEGVERLLRLSFEFLFMLGLPIVIGLFILAYPLVFLITQPEFLSQLDQGIYGSDIAIQILVFAMFFMYMNSVFTYSLVAVDKQYHLLWINGSAAIFNVAANFYFIPILGFRGAAMTSIATEGFILVAAFFVARKFLPFKLNYATILKVVFSAAVMGLVVWLLLEPSYNWFGLENLNVLFLSGLGAVLYGALLLMLGAVPKEFLGKVGLRGRPSI